MRFFLSTFLLSVRRFWARCRPPSRKSAANAVRRIRLRCWSSIPPRVAAVVRLRTTTSVASPIHRPYAVSIASYRFRCTSITGTTSAGKTVFRNRLLPSVSAGSPVWLLPAPSTRRKFLSAAANCAAGATVRWQRSSVSMHVRPKPRSRLRSAQLLAMQ